jgi:hypothetical protein
VEGVVTAYAAVLEGEDDGRDGVAGVNEVEERDGEERIERTASPSRICLSALSCFTTSSSSKRSSAVLGVEGGIVSLPDVEDVSPPGEDDLSELTE